MPHGSFSNRDGLWKLSSPSSFAKPQQRRSVYLGGTVGVCSNQIEFVILVNPGVPRVQLLLGGLGLEGSGEEAGREEASAPILPQPPTAGSAGQCGFCSGCAEPATCAKALLMDQLMVKQRLRWKTAFF